jgi:hypothetical protein
MHLGENPGKTAARMVRGGFAFLTLLFLVLFRVEILGYARFFLGILGFATGEVERTPAFLEFIPFNCLFGFGFIFVLWLLLVAFQALLPISDMLTHPRQALLEAYRAAWYLLFFMVRAHGPAIFVRDGVQITTREDERRRDWPGVIVVDFNSAVVLEERNLPGGGDGMLLWLITRVLEFFFVINPRKSPRICGTGILFTRPLERVHGVVDLRRQFRLLPKIRCYTRDGIELCANVWCLFSVHDPPDILTVTYAGPPDVDSLRVVRLTDLPHGFVRVTGFADDLDLEDKLEIHRFWQSAAHDGAIKFGVYPPVDALPDDFDRRIFSAVCAQAQSHTDGADTPIAWTELPARVAAGFYREVLSQVNYDALYDVHERGEFPLPQFRDRLRMRMRSNGVLAYRILRMNPSGAFEPRMPLIEGQVYRAADLQISPARRLQNPKVLRDRGIKVVFSGFGDLIPVNEEVYAQRLNAWRARWDRLVDERMATSDQRAMHARGAAQLEAQRDLWLSLTALFNEENGEEALALRVLQTLEQAAADPQTRELLPATTIDLMRHITNTLLPPEFPPAVTSPGPSIPPSTGGTP